MTGGSPNGIWVCVDSYSDGIPVGRIYCTSLGVAENFRSTVDFLTRIEQLLSIERSPQHFNTMRTFAPVLGPLPDPPAIMLPRVGKLATLELKILFRQNASWQGKLLWKERKQEQHFRSVLELIFLMDSALGGMDTPLDKEYPA